MGTPAWVPFGARVSDGAGVLGPPNPTPLSRPAPAHPCFETTSGAAGNGGRRDRDIQACGVRTGCMDERVKLGAVLAAGVILPGVTSYLLGQAGFALANRVVWYGGYATMVVVVWYTWLRPLDLSGSSGGTEP